MVERREIRIAAELDDGQQRAFPPDRHDRLRVRAVGEAFHGRSGIVADAPDCGPRRNQIRCARSTARMYVKYIRDCTVSPTSLVPGQA